MSPCKMVSGLLFSNHALNISGGNFNMKKNLIYAVLTVLIWSTMASVVKAILSDIPNMQTLSVSSVFSFLFLLIVNLKSGKIKTLKAYTAKDISVMCSLGFLGLFLYSALYYYGLSVLTAQEACILNYLWPIMLVVFSCILLKEKLTVMKAVAMLCSFFGIVILSLGGGSTPSIGAALGMISCILAAVCYGLFSVLNKKANYDQNVSMMFIWLTTAICAAVFGLCTENWAPIHGAQWLGILWLGVIVDGLAYLLWALALNSSKNTAVIANLAYLTPFLSLIVSAVFLKETLQPKALLALIFIIGGVLLQNYFEFKPKRKV